jgi:hypothetical protein
LSAFLFNPFTGTLDRVVRAGTSGSSEWSRLTGVVSASSTVVVDTVSLADLIGGKYIIAISNDTETNGKMVEMNVLNLTSQLYDNVFSRLDGNIDIEISANINGSNMEISIKNNEVFDVNYNVLKTLFN